MLPHALHIPWHLAGLLLPHFMVATNGSLPHRMPARNVSLLSTIMAAQGPGAKGVSACNSKYPRQYKKIIYNYILQLIVVVSFHWNAMDYLEFFDDVLEGGLVERRQAELPLEPPPQEEVPLQMQGAGGDKLITVGGAGQRPPAPRPLAGMKLNSRGSALERKTWNLAMQIHKQRARAIKTENDVLALLCGLQKRCRTDTAIHLIRTRKGNLFRKNGSLMQSTVHLRSRGNQHSSKWGVSDFLTCAFGADRKHGKRIKSQASQALSLGMAPSTVCYMRAVVAGAVLSRQANMLARIYILCKSQKPMVACLREAFDETSQIIKVQDEKAGWQVCVVRHTMVLVWPGVEPQILHVPIATWLGRESVRV